MKNEGNIITNENNKENILSRRSRAAAISPVYLLYGELANVETLSDVIRLSIAFDKPIKIGGMRAEDPVKEVLGDYSSDKEKKYSRNGDVITYYYDGVQYEIYYTSQVEKILLDNGFEKNPSIKSVFTSPFRMPVDYFDFWMEQRDASRCIEISARLARERAKRKSAGEAASRHGVTPISEDLLRTRCFRIPVDGIDVLYRESKSGDPKALLPLDSDLAGKMAVAEFGPYCTFVYLDGNTYVTASAEVLKELKEHGFSQSTDIPLLEISGVGAKPGSFRGKYQIVDPFYAGKINDVMVSDEEYRDTARKGFVERKIEFLEKKNAALAERASAAQEENEQLKRVLANSYINYRRAQESKGEIALSPREFFVSEFGLDLDMDDDFIAEVESPRAK